MPPLPPSPGVTRALLSYTYDGQRCANVLHFGSPGGGATPDADDLATNLRAWWDTNVRPAVPANCSLDSIITTELDAQGGPSVEYTLGLPASGSGVSPSLPNNVTFVVSLITALRGRSYRGRIYHVGLQESQAVGSRLLPGSQATWINIYDDLLSLPSQSAGVAYVVGVLSYYSLGIQRPSGVFTPAIRLAVDEVLDSQRKRLPGRGN